MLAALAVLGTDAAVMGVWWWGEQGTGTPTRTWLAGVVAAVLVAVVLVTALRHPVARRTAVGALAVAMVVDAVVIGYQLTGPLLP
jgi:hypothetical protein